MPMHIDGKSRNRSSEHVSDNNGNKGEESKRAMELQKALLGSGQEGQSSSDRRNQPPELSDKQGQLKQFYEASEEAGIRWAKPTDGSAPWEDPKHPIHRKRAEEVRKIVGKELVRPEE
jgi:hypothetical protein